MKEFHQEICGCGWVCWRCWVGQAAAAVAMPTLVQQASVSLYQLMELVASLIWREFSVMAMTHTQTEMHTQTDTRTHTYHYTLRCTTARLSLLLTNICQNQHKSWYSFYHLPLDRRLRRTMHCSQWQPIRSSYWFSRIKFPTFHQLSPTTFTHFLRVVM